jgi:hypothetical protein
MSKNIKSGKIRDIFGCKKNSIPNETKNNVIKKSLNGLILPTIPELYGRFPRVIPAINAPIAIENPTEVIINEKKKKTARDTRSNTSLDLAANLNISGNINLLKK